MLQTGRSEAGQPVSPLLVYAAALGFWMNLLMGRVGWVNYPLCVLWSLSVEELFYLVFPLLCVVLRRQGPIAAVWAAVAMLAPVYRAAHQGDEDLFLYATPAAADGIAIGCLAALLAARLGAGARIPGWVRIAVMVSMTALYLSASIAVTNILGVTAMALGAAVLLLPGGRVGRAPPGRVAAAVAWTGRLSYELYLFHLVVLGLIRTVWPPGTVGGAGVLVLLAVYLPASLLLAAVIGRFFAAPANALIRHLGPPRLA